MRRLKYRLRALRPRAHIAVGGCSRCRLQLESQSLLWLRQTRAARQHCGKGEREEGEETEEGKEGGE